MATVLFFEKPGCRNNTRQKRWLAASGHEVRAHNLLQEPWSAERLSGFFGDLPVARWFNPSAPRITSGEVDPQRLSAEQALALMLAEPLFIRRPLLEVAGVRRVGFDPEQIRAWIGLCEEDSGADPEACLRTDNHSCP